jgi:hypothetical protein
MSTLAQRANTIARSNRIATLGPGQIPGRSDDFGHLGRGGCLVTTQASGTRHPAGKFTKVTPDQLAIPMSAGRASPEGGIVSALQKHVLFALAQFAFEKKSCPKDDEIADAIGLCGSQGSRRRQIQIALNGRSYRKLNRETGKRDGDLVNVPGLCDPALGFVELSTLPNGERELALSERWNRRNRYQVFPGGGSEPSDAAGDPEPAMPQPAPPAAKTDAGDVQPAPQVRPSDDELAEVLGSSSVRRSKECQAGKLQRDLSGRNVVLNVGPDGRVHPRLGAGAEPLSDVEGKVLEWLNPELARMIGPGPVNSANHRDRGGPAITSKSAPPVANAGQIRAMIGKLTAEPSPDDSDCTALARMLADEFRDADRVRSEDFYFGIASETKSGKLPSAVMAGAFDASCGPKLVKRGAVFTAEVRKIKSGLGRPGREGKASP